LICHTFEQCSHPAGHQLFALFYNAFYFKKLADSRKSKQPVFELKDSLIQVKEYMTAVYGVKANKNLEELRNQANICILIDKIPIVILF